MGQRRSTKVSPFRIIRMKLTKEGTTNNILLIKISTQPNKECINIRFID